MVEFNSVPASTLVPFTYVEISNQALVSGPTIQPYKALIIGQRRTGSGNVLELVPTLITSPEQGYSAFGGGSQIAKMIEIWFKNNRQTELWAVALDDAAGATKATGTITVTGTATAAGTLVCYLAGERFEVPVSIGDTATVVGASIVSALPPAAIATAINAAGVVTFTAKNGGLYMNGVDIRTSYARGEMAPAGIVAVSANFATGAGSIDVDEVWPFIASQHFNIVALGANDLTNLGKFSVEFADRFSPQRNQEGTGIIGLDKTVAQNVTQASLIDSKFVVNVGTEKSPSPWYEWGAANAAAAALELSRDPARPLQTIHLVGLLAPAETDRWTLEEMETLLVNGVAVCEADAAGRVRIKRLRTTYLTNDAGAPDDSFSDIQTLHSLSYIRYDLRVVIPAKFPRSKVADDGVQAGTGQSIVSPAIMEAFIGGRGEVYAQQLIIEDAKFWRDNLSVTRNPADPNRLDIRVAADLVNQLRVTATRLDFFA